MSKPSVEQLQATHTKMCRAQRLEAANLILAEFSRLYSNEIRSDIQVYMVYECMKDRQFWLSVAEQSVPERI